MNYFTKVRTLLVLLTLTFLTFSCGEKEQKQALKIDQGFREYISAFTGGLVSSKSTITIKLSSAYKQEVEPGTEVDDKLFSFSPKIKGKTVWVDGRTIEFRPSEPLLSDTEYKGTFTLDKICNTSGKYSEFPIQIKVIKQDIRIENGQLSPMNTNEYKAYKYTGTIVSADEMDNTTVETLLKAVYDNAELEINWEHHPKSKTHDFEIYNLKRKESDDMFQLIWELSANGVEIEGSDEIEIPGLDNFKLVSSQVYHQPSQYVLFTFSDPIQKNQNLNGLIQIEDVKNLKLSIEGNKIKAFLNTRISGERKVKVDKAITNVAGYKLNSSFKQDLTFESSKPNVRLIGKGVILPNSQGLILPFEAVNLNAVDVSIIKIYEDNVAQFLQVNELDGSSELKRVGRLVAKKKVDLISDDLIDYGKWNAFSIDLASIISNDPGAIYKIELSFRKSYSLYPCNETEGEQEAEEEENWDDKEDEEQSYWDSAEDYYYYDDDYYYWRDRDNPCKKSYYTSKKASRNILASNLGIIAKSGNSNEMTVIVSDMLTTEPISGASIDIVNYQQQVIGSAQTDAQGMATIELSKKPFLLIAKAKDQRGYLKLSNGSSLSLSKFDVSGASYEKGIKGFIYGERGVWRPGDSIYVSFILEDKDQLLPEEHPVNFELLDPFGKTVERIVKFNGENHFYKFVTATTADAPTGNYTAKVKVGGATFVKYLKIETVKPNRLKIKFDFGKKLITKQDASLKGKMEVKWLHGAIAQNMDAEVNAEIKPITTRFDAYADYIFDDPSVDFYSVDQEIFSGKINDQGIAYVKPNITVNEKSPGMLQATFTTRVFEEGGDYSIDQFSIPYAPYNTFVGIKVPRGDKARGMLLTDQDHKVEVVTVDANGNKVSKSGMKARLYKIEWRWWWQAGNDNIGNYISREHITPIFTKSFSTTDGFGSFEFEVKYPDWGRYLLQVESPDGHSTGKVVYIDWPGWAGRAQSENPGGASMLTFSTDKKNYKVGEPVEVIMPSSEGGRALVSIEKGNKVLDAYWVKTEKDQTRFTFKTTEQMAPNVYINISMLQPHANTVNDLPIRLYGVVPIMVDNPETKLNPIISMADELQPESEVKIKVSEQNGKPMTFTLAVVDEGLLDLTRFKTPSPWHTFYAREALSVRTWDIYDMVIGAYGAKIEQAFAIGGDGSLARDKDNKAQRFKPVVKYFGPYTIGKNKSKEIKFTMPRYIGSVKTMVVAGNNGAYGSTEKATPVKNPLMLFATLPRVLSPAEKVKLPVTLFALDDKIKDVKVELETNEFLNPAEKSKTIHFNKAGEQDFMFDVTASSLLGVGKVKLTATNGREKATYEIELDIRAPHPKQITTYNGVIQPGESWEQDFDVFGIEGTNVSTIEVSGMPPINLDRRLKYLIRYPYGCIEQTTSSVFPQLYLSDITKLNNEQKDEIKDHIDAALKRLISFQVSNGGFTYWPGNTEVDEWGTNYAGHFIIEAEEKGYSLPANMKSTWLNFQKEAANNWSPQTNRYGNNGFTQAYRLFTLALSGNADLGAMNRLKEYEALTIQGRYYLSMAYVYSGNKQAALDLISNQSQVNDSTKIYNNTYGSTERDRAIIVEALLQLEMYEQAMPGIQYLSEQLNTNKWMSTQTTAFCLRTMAKASAVFKKSVDEYTYTYALNQQKAHEVMSTQLINRETIDAGQQNGTQHISVKNTSKAPCYINLSVEGIPMKSDDIAEERNLKLSVVYKTLDDRIISESSIEQGTDFKAEITVTNPSLMGDYENLALNAMFPSGWEIHNTRLYGGGESHTIDIPDYMDIRDDRVNLFFDLKKYEKKTFVILLNAAYLGSYQLPAISCSAMYNNQIRARLNGKEVEVIKPGM